MADDTNTAEREAAEQWLRDRYGAYRGHFAWRELEEAFLAGRASLAASAGSEPEPFGHWFTDDPKSFAMPGSGFLLGKEPPKDAINVIPLYTHPSPTEGMAGLTPTGISSWLPTGCPCPPLPFPHLRKRSCDG